MKKHLIFIVVVMLMASVAFSLDFGEFSRNMDVVNKVDLNRYLGTWYEYARTDVSFERGLINTQANYSLLEPDRKGRTRIRVINSGEKNGKSRKAKGRAVIPFADEPARLKVSFFGPFYGDYNIIALDTEHYQWALVAGSSTKYLWILTREKTLDPMVLESLKMHAERYGFDTDALIYPQTSNE